MNGRNVFFEVVFQFSRMMRYNSLVLEPPKAGSFSNLKATASTEGWYEFCLSLD